MEGIHSRVTRKTFAKDTDAGHPSGICVQLTIGSRIQTRTSRPSYVDVKPYSAPLQTQGRHVHSGQNGTLAVVDEKGKTLPCQPAVGADDGNNYYAYYAAGSGKPPTHTALDFYQPPSSEKPGRA